LASAWKSVLDLQKLRINNAMKKILKAVIKAYKYLISPLLPASCRFTPSCSEYSAEAIEKYGAGKGVYLTIRRILRCHPFHPGGYDPVK